MKCEPRRNTRILRAEQRKGRGISDKNREMATRKRNAHVHFATTVKRWASARKDEKKKNGVITKQ